MKQRKNYMLASLPQKERRLLKMRRLYDLNNERFQHIHAMICGMKEALISDNKKAFILDNKEALKRRLHGSIYSVNIHCTSSAAFYLGGHHDSESLIALLASEGRHKGVNILLKEFEGSVRQAVLGYAAGGYHLQVDALIDEGESKNTAVEGYAIAGDRIKVEALLKAGASKDSAAKGYALAGNDIKVNALILAGASRSAAIEGYAFDDNLSRIEDLIYVDVIRYDAARAYAMAGNGMQAARQINSPIKDYAIAGNDSAVEAEIDAGASINSAVEGYAIAGNNSKVKSLIFRGASRNSAVKGYAIAGNDIQVEAQIREGASINSAIEGYAIAGNNKEVQKKLEKGASINSAVKGYAIAGNDIQVKVQIDQGGASRSAAIEGYAIAGNMQQVELNICAGEGRCSAAKGYAIAGNNEEVEKQLHAGASKNSAIEGYAIAGNNSKVEELIRAGASRSVAVEGYAFANNITQVNAQILAGADRNNAARGYAIAGNHKEVEAQLSAGASKNSAVEGYAIEGNNSRVEALIRAGASRSRAVEYYALVGNDREVDAQLSAGASRDDATRGYAMGGYDRNVQAQLRAGASKNSAIKGYIIAGSNSKVEALIRAGASRNTAVEHYAIAGNVARVEAQIRQGANKDDAVRGYAIAGNVQEVDALLKAGASKNSATKGYAIAGNDSQVEALIHAGASRNAAVEGYAIANNITQVNAQILMGADRGNAARGYAIAGNDIQVKVQIDQGGASRSAAIEGYAITTRWKQRLAGASINRAAEGYAIAGNNSKVEELIRAGASQSAVVEYYALADNVTQVVAQIHAGASRDDAVRGYAISGNDGRVAALLRAGANRNAAVEGYAIAGNGVQVEAQIRQGANKDDAVRGYAIAGNVQEVDALLKAGASKNSATKGYAIAGNDSQVEALIRAGASRNAAVEGYAIANNITQVNAQILMGADRGNAARGYAIAGNDDEVDAQFRAGASVNRAAEGYAIAGNDDEVERLILVGASKSVAVEDYAIAGNNMMQVDPQPRWHASKDSVAQGYAIAGNVVKVENQIFAGASKKAAAVGYVYANNLAQIINQMNKGVSVEFIAQLLYQYPEQYILNNRNLLRFLSKISNDKLKEKMTHEIVKKLLPWPDESSHKYLVDLLTLRIKKICQHNSDFENAYDSTEDLASAKNTKHYEKFATISLWRDKIPNVPSVFLLKRLDFSGLPRALVNLEQFALYSQPYINQTNLQILNLSQMELNRDDTKHLISFLKQHRQLEELYLDQNPIGGQHVYSWFNQSGVEQLASALQAYPSLRKLSLNNVGLVKSDGLALIEMMGSLTSFFELLSEDNALEESPTLLAEIQQAEKHARTRAELLGYPLPPQIVSPLQSRLKKVSNDYIATISAKENKNEPIQAPKKILPPEIQVNNLYQYEDNDIRFILEAAITNQKLLATYAPPLTVGDKATSLTDYLKNEKTQHKGKRTLLIPYNKSSIHWLALIIKINDDEKISEIIYIDSLNDDEKSSENIYIYSLKNNDANLLATMCNEIDGVYQSKTPKSQISSPKRLIQTDSVSCGPLTIENLLDAAKDGAVKEEPHRVTSDENQKIRMKQVRLYYEHPQAENEFYDRQCNNINRSLPIEQQDALLKEAGNHFRPDVVLEAVKLINELEKNYPDSKQIILTALTAHSAEEISLHYNRIRNALQKLFNKNKQCKELNGLLFLFFQIKVAELNSVDLTGRKFHVTNKEINTIIEKLNTPSMTQISSNTIQAQPDATNDHPEIKNVNESKLSSSKNAADKSDKLIEEYPLVDSLSSISDKKPIPNGAEELAEPTKFDGIIDYLIQQKERGVQELYDLTRDMIAAFIPGASKQLLFKSKVKQSNPLSYFEGLQSRAIQAHERLSGLILPIDNNPVEELKLITELRDTWIGFTKGDQLEAYASSLVAINTFNVWLQVLIAAQDKSRLQQLTACASHPPAIPECPAEVNSFQARWFHAEFLQTLQSLWIASSAVHSKIIAIDNPITGPEQVLKCAKETLLSAGLGIPAIGAIGHHFFHRSEIFQRMASLSIAAEATHAIEFSEHVPGMHHFLHNVEGVFGKIYEKVTKQRWLNTDERLDNLYQSFTGQPDFDLKIAGFLNKFIHHFSLSLQEINSVAAAQLGRACAQHVARALMFGLLRGSPILSLEQFVSLSFRWVTYISMESPLWLRLNTGSSISADTLIRGAGLVCNVAPNKNVIFHWSNFKIEILESYSCYQAQSHLPYQADIHRAVNRLADKEETDQLNSLLQAGGEESNTAEIILGKESGKQIARFFWQVDKNVFTALRRQGVTSVTNIPCQWKPEGVKIRELEDKVLSQEKEINSLKAEISSVKQEAKDQAITTEITIKSLNLTVTSQGENINELMRRLNKLDPQGNEETRSHQNMISLGNEDSQAETEGDSEIPTLNTSNNKRM
ncbi:MAG: Ulp1 family isopeptidase [Gammaproteobacteria bacterium]|nr:Ulp1 family isopeptidase [Gammaproteobacteria bacterium]